MITLTINHNIFLTREQRYRLHAGEPVEVTGVSLPVWFHKSVTSEPGREVFCKYRLTNSEENPPVKKMTDGYQINLPQARQTEELRSVPQNILDALGLDELPSSKNLLDVRDGGSEWLCYRQHDKFKKGRKLVNVVHVIEIKTMESLLGSLN